MSSFDSTTRYVSALSRKQRRQKAMQPVSVSMSGGGSAPLGGVVTLTGDQEISGLKDFANGLNIGGLPIRRINENTVFIDANVAFGGAATMFGKGSTTFPAIWANIPIDGNTIGRNEQGELYVIGGTGGGGGVADSVAWSNITDKPEWIGASKPSYTYSEIGDTPDLTIYATQSSVDAISTKLNDFLEGEDADTIINKWKELESVLSGLKESDNLATILSGKADSATTLAGYGITDAYTQKAVDDALAKYVLLDTAQRITAQHDFTKGLLIDGLAIKKSQDKTIYIDGNLVISGAMTMFGKDSTTFPTIWANIPFDDTLKWDGSQWGVDKDKVGGGGASVTKDAIVSALGYTPLSANGGTISGHINFNNASYPDIRGNGSYITFSPDNVNGSKGSIGLYKNSDGSFALRRVWDHYSYGVMDFGASGYRWHTVYAKSGNFSDNVTATSFIGNLTGTAESAKKLQTPRTIWGQKFDGTNDIANNTIGTMRRLQFVNTDTSTVVGYIGCATSNNNHVSINSTQNNQLRLGTSSGIALTITESSNVAIGGTTASEKLHVHGNILTTGNVVFDTAGTNTIKNIANVDTYYEFTLSHATNGRQIILNNSASVFGYENPIKGIPTYLDGLSVSIRTGANHAYKHTFTDGGNVSFANNITANRLYANNGFVLTDGANQNCGLMSGATISSTGNPKDMWLYNSLADIKVYTTSVFSVLGGNVAIGDASAPEKLSVYGNVALASGSANPYISIKDNTGATWYVQYARDCLWFGLGTAKSLSVDRSGNVVTIGAITMVSQASLKNIINREGLSLDELSRIRPARFKWKDGRDDRVHVGVVADEIVDILPEVVYFTGEEKTMTVDYVSKASFIATSLIAPVVNHEEEIKQLKKRVTTLENENKKPKQLIA